MAGEAWERSDTNELYRAIREEVRERRWTRRGAWSHHLEQLRREGKVDGIHWFNEQHVRVTAWGGTEVDVWPSTGKFRLVGPRHSTHSGWAALMATLGIKGSSDV